ncbi:hypothetical protein EDEG_01735 [Edhazardia aedis USNM 41457]|uniref:Uncharacterized protein n=1 Tax=Edhazardia aedis (strain USNM 41457) TaxID=1003232 RepID=J8ZW98_EDHAE|nr:hypothetical protein EDEG_01735 [Edhazardia aedis USNM 41457]|eukprot:EJW03968.1 hypothetical protein EDEG_01735 [Edhazardia aedis USNM 41457]
MKKDFVRFLSQSLIFYEFVMGNDSTRTSTLQVRHMALQNNDSNLGNLTIEQNLPMDQVEITRTLITAYVYKTLSDEYSLLSLSNSSILFDSVYVDIFLFDNIISDNSANFIKNVIVKNSDVENLNISPEVINIMFKKYEAYIRKKEYLKRLQKNNKSKLKNNKLRN